MLRHSKHPPVLFLLSTYYVNCFEHYITPVYHLSTKLCFPASMLQLVCCRKSYVFNALQTCEKTATTSAGRARDLAACLIQSNCDSGSNSKSSKFDRRAVKSMWRHDLVPIPTVTPSGLLLFREHLHARTYSLLSFHKDRGRSHCTVSLESRGTSPLHSGDHRYINICGSATCLSRRHPSQQHFITILYTWYCIV
jgi:hypothetical protein